MHLHICLVEYHTVAAPYSSIYACSDRADTLARGSAGLPDWVLQALEDMPCPQCKGDGYTVNYLHLHLHLQTRHVLLAGCRQPGRLANRAWGGPGTPRALPVGRTMISVGMLTPRTTHARLRIALYMDCRSTFPSGAPGEWQTIWLTSHRSWQAAQSCHPMMMTSASAIEWSM